MTRSQIWAAARYFSTYKGVYVANCVVCFTPVTYHHYADLHGKVHCLNCARVRTKRVRAKRVVNGR